MNASLHEAARVRRSASSAGFEAVKKSAHRAGRSWRDTTPHSSAGFAGAIEFVGEVSEGAVEAPSEG